MPLSVITSDSACFRVKVNNPNFGKVQCPEQDSVNVLSAKWVPYPASVTMEQTAHRWERDHILTEPYLLNWGQQDLAHRLPSADFYTRHLILHNSVPLNSYSRHRYIQNKNINIIRNGFLKISLEKINGSLVSIEFLFSKVKIYMHSNSDKDKIFPILLQVNITIWQ